MRIQSILLTLVSVFLASTYLQALPGIPDGVYVGTGSMQVGKDPPSSYDAKLTLKSDEMIAEYTYESGSAASYSARIVVKEEGTFDIFDDEQLIGNGACVETVCRLDIPVHKAHETINFHDGELRRVGSMDHGGVELVYSERLMPTMTAKATSQILLECTGKFQFSDTKSVVLQLEDDGSYSLIENKKKKEPIVQILSAEEVAKGEFKISQIHAIDRIIKKVEGKWALAYGCGEVHEISCVE